MFDAPSGGTRIQTVPEFVPHGAPSVAGWRCQVRGGTTCHEQPPTRSFKRLFIDVRVFQRLRLFARMCSACMRCGAIPSLALPHTPCRILGGCYMPKPYEQSTVIPFRTIKTARRPRARKVTNFHVQVGG